MHRLRPAGAAIGLAFLASAGAVAVGDVSTSGDPGDEAPRLIGDWEPPDALLVGRHPLWADVVERLARDVHPVALRVLEADGPTGPGSAWVRDFGPLQVEAGGGPLWLDAWYDDARPVDDGLPARLGRALGVRVQDFPYRLDGGAIASDGRGLCVMTERSAGQLRAGSDSTSLRQLGCESLVVVPALPGEPTGHVDLVAQFVAPDVVVVAEPVGAGVSPRLRLRFIDAGRRIAAAARARGRPMEIVHVPVFRHRDGRHLSYVNVVSLADRLLVPGFRDVPADVERRAHARLRAASGKELLVLAADEISLADGGLHCVILGLHLSSRSR